MNTNSSKNSFSKADRKTIEKNRRNHMRILCSQLNSLVPHNASSSREPLTLPDQIHEATNYIQNLQESLKNLKRTKDSVVAGNNGNILKSPIKVEVHEKEGALEVNLVTGLDCQFVFTEAIRILHEEHADVVNANYCVTGNTVFHTIHAKIGEAGDGRISERLKNFAHYVGSPSN